MINSDFPKINCPKCGHSDWYVLGMHRTCRPCNAASQRRYRERQALGRDVDRQSRVPRPLSQSLALPPVPAERRRQRKACPRGHSYAGRNVRWQADRLGRVARVCRQCHRETQRERYGMPRPSGLADMLRQAESA